MNGGPILGQVVIDYIRKQAEETIENKPVRSFCFKPANSKLAWVSVFYQKQKPT